MVLFVKPCFSMYGVKFKTIPEPAPERDIDHLPRPDDFPEMIQVEVPNAANNYMNGKYKRVSWSDHYKIANIYEHPSGNYAIVHKNDMTSWQLVRKYTQIPVYEATVAAENGGPPPKKTPFGQTQVAARPARTGSDINIQ